ncbi:MAG: FtsQ-type POTRA domain-containing protein [Gammaproteobacteria bacterium]|nr:FtsQ-type POTRA domain-containing protein [Gammaproteobacteria bacterium]
MFKRQHKRKSAAVRKSVLPDNGRVQARIIKPLLLMLVVGVTVFAINKVYSSLALFPVKQVRVEGEFKYLDKAGVEKKIEELTVGGFFDINIVAIRNELLTMPWVKRAFVRREWPDKVVIRVVEKQAVAKWLTDSVLTAEGELFYPPDIIAVEPMVELRGPDNRHGFVLDEFMKIQKMVSHADITVTALEQNERRSWKMKVQGMTINLGRKNIYKKIESFAAVYASLIKPQVSKIKQIDFRFTNGFAVVWKTKAEINMHAEYKNTIFTNQKRVDLTLMTGTIRNV